MDTNSYLVPDTGKVKLKHFDPADTGKFKDKTQAQPLLEKGIQRLAQLQDVLYASRTWSVLVIIQAMDAAGKDSVVKHVMSGVNPQGVRVTSFKAPSEVELDHDYLWRCARALPPRGQIGIFNRSYYEEVLVVKVNPGILAGQRLPESLKTEKIWKHRHEDINDFERHLSRNGTKVVKFFLNVSKQEQKKRFLERIDKSEKNWKFDGGDLSQRALWDKYMEAYEKMLSHTSTPWAPWHVIPADHKWFTRLAVADVLVKTLEGLDLKYPRASDEAKKALKEQKKRLEKE